MLRSKVCVVSGKFLIDHKTSFIFTNPTLQKEKMNSAFYLCLYILFDLFLDSLPTSTLQKKDQGNIGKCVMKDQPMPEAMKGLLHDDPASALDSKKKMKHF